MQIKIDYSNIENLKYYCKNNDIFILKIEYFDVAVCNLAVKNNIIEKFLSDIQNKKIEIIENVLILNKIIF